MSAAPAPAAPRRRMRLSRQAALVTLAVASVAVLLTGAVAFNLIRGAGEGETQRVLGHQADQVAAAAQRSPGPGRRAGEAALLVLLGRQQIRLIEIFSDGTTSPSPPAPLSAADVQAVQAGRSVSAIRSAAGTRYFVQARPTASIGGGIALVQPTSQARSVIAPLQRRLLVALLVGLAGAGVAGAFLARLLARPLGEAARAAHALAGGHRDVRIAPRGAAEVAEVAQSLNLLAEALRFSEGRQRAFLLSVSHELRTPLTAIEGFAEALADGVTTGADVPAAGAVVLAEAQRLERLVRDSPASAPILDALADNALRVVPPGAPAEFTLRREEPAGAAVLQVRDGGPGLTAEDCAVAFEPSALHDRYRGTRRVGTGIGLALVGGLASRLGGTAEAGRAPEGGAAFTIRLPL